MMFLSFMAHALYDFVAPKSDLQGFQQILYHNCQQTEKKLTYFCTSSPVSLSCFGVFTLYELSLMINLKSSSNSVSIVLEDAIRVPSRPLHTTLSMPLSSRLSISRKSPTVLEMGFSVNLHRSFLLGSGTVIWGRPRWYSTVTSEKKNVSNNINRYYVLKRLNLFKICRPTGDSGTSGQMAGLSTQKCNSNK